MPDLDPHYHRWNQNEIVTRFADKAPDDFFESERRLLTPVADRIHNVIDIGCASGRFIGFLETLASEPRRYTGIDLSAPSIARARELYPHHDFHCANALDFTPAGAADLVNATGVVQHEPRFAELITRMISWSRHFVMFDCKLATMDTHLADLDRARIACDPPMYFIVLSVSRLRTELAARTDISRAHIFGYPTPLNRNAVVPDGLGPVISAGVLLTKGTPASGGPEITLELPPTFATETLHND